MSALLLHSAYFGFGYFNYPTYGNIYKVSINLGVIFTYACAFLLPYSKDQRIREAFVLVFIINILWTLMAGLGFTSYYGFDYNLSVTASVISLMFPVVIYLTKEKHKYILGLLTFSAILGTKASAGLGGFIGACFVYGWMKVSKLWTVVVTALGVLVSYLIYGKELFEANGRLWAWKTLYLNEALKNNKLFGIGFGVSPSYFQVLQTKYKIHRTNEVFWWAHNDLLQIFFECGPIITAYIALIYLFYLARSYKNSCVYSLMFLVSYGVNSLTNFPHHHATGVLCVLMGVVIVHEEYLTKKEIS